jgi:predicted  nucleic acid-binding Zn-ribbon protein
MTDPNAFSESFSKFVPGFEFLQGLVKNAGQTLPSIGQWVAPTLDPAELERRINELRTVQFWLEQNAKMIGTTVQALEVQRMTLGTLKSMNVQMGDLGEALKVRPMSDMFQAAAQAATAAAAAPAAPAPAPAPAPAESAAAPAVDPMQWWGALTQQFTELATQAMQATSEATADAQARAAEALKASTEAAAQAQARASEVLAEAVKEVVSNAAETVAVAAPKKTAARKAAPKPASAAPAPASVAAAKPAATARKAPARKSVKG